MLVGNINMHALDVNSDAIATAVLTFADDSSSRATVGRTAPASFVVKDPKVLKAAKGEAAR